MEEDVGPVRLDGAVEWFGLFVFCRGVESCGGCQGPRASTEDGGSEDERHDVSIKTT